MKLKEIFQILLLVTCLACCGCKSTICMESKNHLHRFDGGAQPMYVTNPGMHKEFEILVGAGIYSLTNQPDGARKLTLFPIKHYARCANPLMLSAITLGIIPGVLPGALEFRYDVETNGNIERRAHFLPTYDRISIWEWFVSHDDKKVLAEALAWSTMRQRSDKSVLQN